MDGIHNAIITGTALGYEGSGILTAWIYLDYGGSAQAFGGYALDQRPASRAANHPRTPSAFCGAFVSGVLRAVGAETWESLKGLSCRTMVSGGRVQSVGHFLKDRWYNPGSEP